MHVAEHAITDLRSARAVADALKALTLHVSDAAFLQIQHDFDGLPPSHYSVHLDAGFVGFRHKRRWITVYGQDGNGAIIAHIGTAITCESNHPVGVVLHTIRRGQIIKASDFGWLTAAYPVPGAVINTCKFCNKPYVRNLNGRNQIYFNGQWRG